MKIKKMINKKINIPEFHLWKLILFIGLLTIIVLYVLERNSTSELRFKLKNTKTEIKQANKQIDSIYKLNKQLDLKLANQTKIITDFKAEKEKYINRSNYYKKQRDEAITNYNALNSEQRLQSAKQLLHE